MGKDSLERMATQMAAEQERIEMNNKTTRVSVIIPTYKSDGEVVRTAEEIQAELDKEGIVNEILIVEDCGLDGSWDDVKSLANRNTRIRAIRLRRNYGQHNALLCGLRKAKYEVTLTMDDDGQHPASEAVRLIREVENGADLVYGTPRDEKHSKGRNWASVAIKRALELSSEQKTSEISAFRALKTELREEFAEYTDKNVNIDALLNWTTSHTKALPVHLRLRAQGQSSYSKRKLIRHTANLIIGFSSLPIKVSSIVGIAVTAFGGLALAFVIGGWAISGSAVPGFVFTTSLICLFSGTQLIALGVLGEYIARIHNHSLGRPAYTIAEEVYKPE